LKHIFTVLLCLGLFACSGQESPSPVTVNTDGNHYRNAFFGVSVDKPEGWYSQPPEETMALQQRGSEALMADEKNKQALIDASLKSSVPVFGFFRVPPGTPGKPNPNVMAVAENLNGFPGVKSGCDYLHFVRQLLEKGQFSYAFSGECGSRKLAGESFGYLEGKVARGDVTVTQRYYATVREGYALSFIQTFFSAEGEAETRAILDSIEIEPM